MVKQGHRLEESVPDLPKNLLVRLRDDFSISTVEEFVAANARASEKIRKHLQLSEVVWNNIVHKSKSVLSDDMIQKLEAPVLQKFAKGALKDLGNKDAGDLEQFITRE